jgi:hypothetical protein
MDAYDKENPEQKEEWKAPLKETNERGKSKG